MVEAHRDCADEALAVLREEMENAVSLKVPLDVDAKWARHGMRASKKIFFLS